MVKEKVPSCVQFEKDTKIDIYSAQSLPFFEPKQLPEKLNSLYFDGSIETLPSLDMDLYSLVLSGNDLCCYPIFKEVVIENETKTAICFITSLV